MKINQNKSRYTLATPLFRGSKGEILEARDKVAESIDTRRDFVLTDKEIKDYLKKENILKDKAQFDVDEEAVVRDFKINLQSKTIPQRGSYHSYAEVMKELKDLEAKHPDLAKTVSLGKTHEGRDIMAIKISKGAAGDTSNKPGFLITGTHHAREWMAMEAPFNIIKTLVNGYDTDEKIKNRLDNAEVWVVPIENPDGYEYSRNEDSYWRKNRQPIHKDDIPKEIAQQMTADANGVVSYGVDPNRNYYDGNPEHFELYRPAGDTPESTADDFGGWWFPSTSDNPKQDVYRGPGGGSEKETQAMLGLWLNKSNIKGIVNHHSYGRKIMYPYGVSTDPVPNKKVYEEIANRMHDAIEGADYKVMQSSGLYTASGDPDDFAQVNGKLSMTIEIGTSFHEPESQIEPINKRMYNANMAFLDWIIENKDDLMKEKEGKPEGAPQKSFDMPGKIEL